MSRRFAAPRRGTGSPPGQELLGVITSHGPSRESYRSSRKSRGSAEAFSTPAAHAVLSAERMRAALSSPAGAPALLQRRMPEGGAEMVAVESPERYRESAAGQQKRNDQSRRYRERVKDRKPAEPEAVNEAARVITTEHSFRSFLRPTGMLPGDSACASYRQMPSRRECWIVRQTLAAPRCQSMSLHLRAKYSLGLIPVVMASANSANHSDSLATVRNRLHSSTLRASISRLFNGGRSTPTQGLRPTFSSVPPGGMRTAVQHSYIRLFAAITHG